MAVVHRRSEGAIVSYEKMMHRAVKKAQAWEHDGTNLRGLSSHCEDCGRILLPGLEKKLCGWCSMQADDREKAGREINRDQ